MAEATRGKGPRLLYSDQDLVVQALRDYLDSTIDEVLVDDDEVLERAEAYMRASMPRSKTRLVRYTERMPLFSRFDLEPQIDAIYAAHRVAAERRLDRHRPHRGAHRHRRQLGQGDARHQPGRDRLRHQPRGGARGRAPAPPARHRRARGGRLHRHALRASTEREVERTLREAMKADKARSHVGRISPNGLLEINRQRIGQALQLRTHAPARPAAAAAHRPPRSSSG